MEVKELKCKLLETLMVDKVNEIKSQFFKTKICQKYKAI